MIEPPPASRICGRTACAAKNWWRRLTCHALVPIVDRDILGPVAVVVAGIVDQHPDRARGASPRFAIAARSASMSRRSQGMKGGLGALARRSPRPEPREALLGDIDEGRRAALRAEMLDQAFADAAAAAGDEDAAALQAWIDCGLIDSACH